jgi:hypothetical protein
MPAQVSITGLRDLGHETVRVKKTPIHFAWAVNAVAKAVSPRNQELKIEN